jgi:HD superfamily phosphohydrolase
MSLAVKTLSDKGHALTPAEEEAVMIAILLHDIGHGPFSHALEKNIVQGIDHEDISTLLMNRLNTVFNGQLTMAIEIFNDTYHKKFLHQLVSSQLDMDRLDYLNRDSFYTGVSEGVISSERIIKMLNVVDDAMVVEEKGIYSIEKFLVARRLMYWQVYLHKTVTSGEQMLGKILKRARELSLQGQQLFSTPALNHFLQNSISKEKFISEDHHIETFTCLDDTDVMSAVKVWTRHPDKVLSVLCESFIQRRLYHVDITNTKPDAERVEELRQKAMKLHGLCFEDAGYFVFTDVISNNAYKVGDGNIKILMKGGTITDITTASDNSNLEALAKTVEKYIFCYTKDLIKR